MPLIAVSIVSHDHGRMVAALARTLLTYKQIGQVIITLNVPESCDFPNDPRLSVIRNATPGGFSKNHNHAFTFCRARYFCVLNPDIQFSENPFAALLQEMERETNAPEALALTAPLVRNQSGGVEDSMRHFPTLSSLLNKAMGISDGRYHVRPGDASFHPEWVAGMFLLFRASAFRRMNGFDERFFLYYEDVDICARLWKAGLPIMACPRVSVIHDARRDSRRNARYLRWHLGSMGRYFWKHWGRLPRVDQAIG